MPTNPSQVATNRRHFATIGVTVPTKPAKSIRIRGDDNIGRMSDAQHLPNAAARPISASRVGPSCQDTRHVGRSHSTDTLTCASSDSTLDHALAPSDRLTITPTRL